MDCPDEQSLVSCLWAPGAAARGFLDLQKIYSAMLVRISSIRQGSLRGYILVIRHLISSSWHSSQESTRSIVDPKGKFCGYSTAED